MMVGGLGSLQRRLSVWLAIQSLLGMSFLCTGVYGAMAGHLRQSQSDVLAQKAEALQHLMDESTGLDPLALQHRLDDFAAGHEGLRVRLDLPAVAAMHAPSTPHAEDMGGAVLRQSVQPPRGAVVQGWRAEIALGTARDDALLLQLRWILGLAAVFGALVISAGGAWLVRVGLAPLRHLSEQLQYLRASSLSQRLDGSGQVLELQPVIGEFNALLSRLDDSYRQLEGFNADVAHELKTPLANLISSCELGLRKSRDLAALRDLLGDNLEELHRLSGMVNDMLFLAQADRGARARCTWTPSLACLARDVLDFHEAALQEAQLQWEIRGDVAASVDAGLLRRALSNLLSNATRYAHTGSTVIVEIQAQGGQVEVRVRNTGPEIASAELARIFDRFYRADVSRSDAAQNHGLGLSIVSAIARMHGGHTLARSDQGETCIGLALPQGAPGPGADQFISRRLRAT